MSGRAYAVGTKTCDGGLHIIDVGTNPLKPTFLGCYESDGYTHDAEVITYHGMRNPPLDFTRRRRIGTGRSGVFMKWLVTHPFRYYKQFVDAPNGKDVFIDLESLVSLFASLCIDSSHVYVAMNE